MLERTLRYMNPWWEGDYRFPGHRRQRYLDEIQKALDLDKIAILYGLRRVGKTTLLRQYAHATASRIEPDRILFASMDHPDCANISIMELLETFRRLNRLSTGERHVLILDEVQHRHSFDTELKALYDLEDGLKIVVSGSSSLVIRHQTPALTGKDRKIRINPLTFDEFLVFCDAEYDPHQPSLMESHMEEYLITGGMPEYVLTRDTQTLMDLTDSVIFRDIALVYDIRDPRLLKDLFFLLMDRTGRPLSYSKIGRLIGVVKESARKYVGFFEDTFLLDLVEKDGTPNEMKASPRKCYCPDNGIRVMAAGDHGIGSLAENLVYQILRDLGPVRYVIKGGREIDFRVGDALIEVKYKDKLDDDDLSAIRDAKMRGITRRYIITRRETDGPKNITVVSLWKFAHDGGFD